MVFVKVRETYDLKTVQDKMTVIGIHTPKPEIIKRNFPGLLLQCKMYRPVSANVRIACASTLPLDPLGVGTSSGDVAPEDMFNPILYKAMSNKGMSQLEARINALGTSNLGLASGTNGDTAVAWTSGVTSQSDDFGAYYGLLSQTNEWRHANVQQGLSMDGLKPLVYEIVYNVGDFKTIPGASNGYPYQPQFTAPKADGSKDTVDVEYVLGDAKPFPWLPCTIYSGNGIQTGFPNPNEQGGDYLPYNLSTDVPYMLTYCGAIIVPPSRLHSLYFRMVCEWVLEFSAIRPIGEITDWSGLAGVGNKTHFQNYSYSSTKEALTGDSETILTNDATMVSSNAEITKVM